MSMGPTWGPSGADKTQVGSMLAPWTLLSGIYHAVQQIKAGVTLASIVVWGGSTFRHILPSDLDMVHMARGRYRNSVKGQYKWRKKRFKIGGGLIIKFAINRILMCIYSYVMRGCLQHRLSQIVFDIIKSQFQIPNRCRILNLTEMHL